MYVFGRVGVDLPTIEVRFEHMNVEAEAHVGSRALPSFLNFNINMVEVTTYWWWNVYMFVFPYLLCV